MSFMTETNSSTGPTRTLSALDLFRSPSRAAQVCHQANLRAMETSGASKFRIQLLTALDWHSQAPTHTTWMLWAAHLISISRSNLSTTHNTWTHRQSVPAFSKSMCQTASLWAKTTKWWLKDSPLIGNGRLTTNNPLCHLIHLISSNGWTRIPSRTLLSILPILRWGTQQQANLR